MKQTKNISFVIVVVVFAVAFMFEGGQLVKSYIKKHDVTIPVPLDKGGKLPDGFEIKY
jgi:hypothetical protein